MPMVRAMRLLNAIEAGTTSGAQLQTLLTDDPGRLAELNVLLGLRGQSRRVAASSTAMTAMLASEIATNAILKNPTALASVFASSTATNLVVVNSIFMASIVSNILSMNLLSNSSVAIAAIGIEGIGYDAIKQSSMAIGKYIIGIVELNPESFSNMTDVTKSSSALTKLVASPLAMLAVWRSDIAADIFTATSNPRSFVYESDTALGALQATPAQVQNLINTKAINGASTAANIVVLANGSRAILLRRSYDNGTSVDAINWARGSVSANVGQGPKGGIRNLDTEVTALGATTTYADSGIFPSNSTSSNSNFVSAANGLQRRTGTGTWRWSYLLVA